jgi:hypothetical protein
MTTVEEKNIDNEYKKENIKDRDGNIKKDILAKMVDNFIDKNPLIYDRLAEI